MSLEKKRERKQQPGYKINIFFKEVLFRWGFFIFFKFYLVEVYNDKQPVEKKEIQNEIFEGLNRRKAPGNLMLQLRLVMKEI